MNKNSKARALTVGALAALVVAVGGTASASGQIDGGEIVNGTITSADVHNGTLTGTDVKNGTIGNADLVDHSVSSAKLGNGSVTDRAIATGQVTSADVQDFDPVSGTGGITSADLNPEVIQALQDRFGKDANGSFVPLNCQPAGTLCSVPEGTTLVNLNVTVDRSLNQAVQVTVTSTNGEVTRCVAVPNGAFDETCSAQGVMTHASPTDMYVATVRTADGMQASESAAHVTLTGTRVG